MNEFLFSLNTGVVSGLVATVIVVVVRSLWIKVIEPWYENVVYKDAEIKGHWKGKGTFYFTDGPKDEDLVWTLTRTGHRVEGMIVCTSGPDQGQTYDIVGDFRNLLLTATYSARDTTALDRGTLSLMLINNGQTLYGHCLYYSYADHKVHSCEYKCERHSDRSSAG